MSSITTPAGLPAKTSKPKSKSACTTCNKAIDLLNATDADTTSTDKPSWSCQRTSDDAMTCNINMPPSAADQGDAQQLAVDQNATGKAVANGVLASTGSSSLNTVDYNVTSTVTGSDGNPVTVTESSTQTRLRQSQGW
jgi:hypothetical protein